MSKAFGKQKKPAGKEFRDGLVGKAVDDLYKDIEQGFDNLEQAAITDIEVPGASTAAANATKLNTILAALRDAGIIAE